MPTTSLDKIPTSMPRTLASHISPQSQDPTLAASTVPRCRRSDDGSAAAISRPGGITTTWGKNWNGYDSIQMSFNRRFRNRVQATLNYTLGLRTIGNTGAQLRLQHNPDGTFVVRDDQEVLDKLLRNTGNRPRHQRQLRVGAPRHFDERHRNDRSRRDYQ